jgi:hypothetical protein
VLFIELSSTPTSALEHQINKFFYPRASSESFSPKRPWINDFNNLQIASATHHQTGQRFPSDDAAELLLD